MINRLPVAFNESLFQLIDELENEEEEYSYRKITIEDLNNEEFIDKATTEWVTPERLMAWCLHHWSSWSWLNDVNHNWNYLFDIEWFEYYICTDEEANEAHEECIRNLVDDIWFEWFNWWNYIDVSMDEDWDITISKEIFISHSERGNMLAWYDWYENEININWNTYYIYRNN